jgi:4-amino-4-deoxy-L-arabinose transferase-like glycosyltransferase
MESLMRKLVARPELAILVLGLVLMLTANWNLPLTDRDEANYSEQSREMLQRDDYVVPWFNGHPFLTITWYRGLTAIRFLKNRF